MRYAVGDDDLYGRLRYYINKLYNSFEYFQEMWKLSKYSDLCDNETAQKEIHSDFKKSIQVLMCFCEFYIFSENWYRRQNGWVDTLRDYLIRNIIDDVVSLDTSGKLFDIIPQNEDEINNLVNFLVRSDNDNENGDFFNHLQHSRSDDWFRQRRMPVTDTFLMTFEPVSDVTELLVHVWMLCRDS